MSITINYAANPRFLAILPLLTALTGACGDSGDFSDYTAGYDPGSGSASMGDEHGGESGDTEAESGDTDESTGEPAQCDAETPVSLYLSPDDSNSTSSPVQARAAVLGGFGGLDHVPIRTWEFLNYYSFNYGAAEQGMLTMKPEIARTDDMPDGQYTVQIGVAAESMADSDRPLMNVTLVLDESGSMEGVAIEMERAVCQRIVHSLREGDVVSMVGWDTENAVKLAGHVVTGPDDEMLSAACSALQPGGGTDLNGGLVAGYELAHQQYDAARINRVVLISDGGANAGVTDIDLISGGAGSQDQDGIYLVGVGVGTAETYNDELMDAVTDAGRGASLFVPTVDEAQKMFGERFVQTMAVAARDVQVRLDMPPGFSIVKFSGEEYSANPAEIEPQHLAPNDAMVFHQTVATCAPTRVDQDAELTVAIQWRDAVTFAPRSAQVTRKIQEILADESPMLKKGAAVFAYAEALKAHQDAHTVDTLGPALTALSAAEAALPGDRDLAEIRLVLQTLVDQG